MRKKTKYTALRIGDIKKGDSVYRLEVNVYTTEQAVSLAHRYNLKEYLVKEITTDEDEWERNQVYIAEKGNENIWKEVVCRVKYYYNYLGANSRSGWLLRKEVTEIPYQKCENCGKIKAKVKGGLCKKCNDNTI